MNLEQRKENPIRRNIDPQNPQFLFIHRPEIFVNAFISSALCTDLDLKPDYSRPGFSAALGETTHVWVNVHTDSLMIVWEVIWHSEYKSGWI